MLQRLLSDVTLRRRDVRGSQDVLLPAFWDSASGPSLTSRIGALPECHLSIGDLSDRCCIRLSLSLSLSVSLSLSLHPSIYPCLFSLFPFYVHVIDNVISLNTERRARLCS